MRFFTSVLTLTMMACPAVVHGFDFDFPGSDSEASFDITETLNFDFHDDNFDGDPSNDHYYDLTNRLNLKLAVSRFTVSTRLDSATFFSVAKDADPPYLDRYAAEKATVAYRNKNLSISLGDFYASFGRGMALRVRKTDQLNEDTTLLGAKLRTTLGPFDLTALGGLSNPTNTDAVSEKTLSDPYDLLAGVRASYRTAHNLLLAAHGLWVRFDPLEQNSYAQGQIETSVLPSQTFVTGLSFEAPDLGSIADFYAEFDWMTRQLTGIVSRTETGWAAYAGANLYLGDWTTSVELKAYQDYELYTFTDAGKYANQRLDYIRPPTLEPEDMEINNNFDVVGGRVKLDWRPGAGKTLLFGSYAGFLAQDPLSVGSRWIYNLQIGVEQDFWKRGLATAVIGLREEVPDWAGGEHFHLIYLNTILKIPLSARHSIEIHGKHWWQHWFLGSPSGFTPADSGDYVKGDWSLGYSFAPFFSAALLLGYDGKLSGEEGLSIFVKHGDGPPRRQVFLAGSISINISSDVIVKILAGQLTGGPKCVNGSCRIFPSFAGARFETTIRF